MRIDELVAFARERHSIYERRAQGLPKPWTKDEILQQYKFCNVYRELDKVTIWIRENWREPNKEHHHIWLSMTIARFLNNIPCLDALPYPNGWDGKMREQILKILKDRKQRKLQVFGGAYMVRSDPGCKIDYLDSVLKTMWAERYQIESRGTITSLRGLYEVLYEFRGMGSFMAAQVVADLKHVYPYSAFPDCDTFAASGPGSQRGLCRVLDYPISHVAFKEDEWYELFMKIYTKAKPMMKKVGLPPVDAQDFQGLLCEADKMWRVKNGEGTPRSRYNGVN